MAPSDRANQRAQPDHQAVGQTKAPLWRRLAWMAAIWLASVTALGAIAWLLRLWIA